jgi:hypothetical protein
MRDVASSVAESPRAGEARHTGGDQTPPPAANGAPPDPRRRAVAATASPTPHPVNGAAGRSALAQPDPRREQHEDMLTARHSEQTLAPRPTGDFDLEQLVARVIARCRAAEGQNVFGSYGASGLTPAIRRLAAQLEHGGLAPGSEAESLKSADRLSAKLTRLIARHPDRTAEDLAAGLVDAVRYAFTFETERYTEGTWLVHRKLKSQGFELEARRNRWESPEYKGVWSRWRDPAHDLIFEVQFHTFASWDIVQGTHEAFRVITDPATPPAERARLRARQVAAARAARTPPGCAEITDFGWDAR